MTSGRRRCVYPSLADHPLRQLNADGVAITINSDDPPFFGTRLTQELKLLPAQFGLDADAIDEILLNGVRHSFLSQDRRAVLEADFRSELAVLRKTARGAVHD